MMSGMFLLIVLSQVCVDVCFLHKHIIIKNPVWYCYIFHYFPHEPLNLTNWISINLSNFSQLTNNPDEPSLLTLTFNVFVLDVVFGSDGYGLRHQLPK